MNAKILEIFQSIQGEGEYAGAPQVFVRFFECHMHCAWCDTPHSIGDTTRNFKEMSLAQVSAEVKNLWRNCHSVSLTGGEPLLQKDFIRELLPYFKKNKMPAYLETSGVLYQELSEVIDGVDIVAMDFKLPSSTQCRAYWPEHEAFLKIARAKDLFIKAVISSRTKISDVETAVQLLEKIDPHILFILQPNYFEMRSGVMEKCLAFQNYCAKYLKNVRIMPQMHKIMKLR